MIRKLIIILSIVFFADMLHAQDEPLLKKWSYNTASLMPARKWESGLFQPFRYGINQKMEIFTNVLMLPFIPEAGAKLSWGTKNDFAIASEHSLSVPTPFLNMISRKGIGGLISPEYDFSFILSVSNSIIVSRKIASSAMITANGGYVFALRGKKPDPQSSIDMPLFYPRMAHYYEGTSIRLGTAVKGSIGSRWFYEEGVKAFLITRSENNFFFENTGTIMWAGGKSLRIRGGYILAYGKYPYLTPKWQMWPTLDLVFGSK
ncbi:MAG: hypothetical protein Q7U54_07100 [Bacteroidales bacterium]|nr:hypothetical protein [Bacteroidales bacterium]